MIILCLVFVKTPIAQNTNNKPVSEGKCLRFDGVNDVVNAGDINAFDSSQHLTAEMWVRIDQFDAWRTFFCKFQNLANRIQFQQYSEPGKIAVVVNNSADIKKEGNQAYYYTPNPEVTIGDWFHLAMVFDGTQPEQEQRLKLFINGMPRTLKKEGTARGTVPTHLPSTSAPMLLGAEKPKGEYGYKGLMDEIRIWTVARSEQQIRDNMDHSLHGTEDGLRLYYPVDAESESSKSLLDRASEKQHASLINFNIDSCFIDREVTIPVTAASAQQILKAAADNFRIIWIRGSGSSNLVFATDRDTGIPSPEPGTTYTANPEYGKGSRIGETHWYCVYNGYDAETSVTGLAPSTEYRLAIIDYNGSPGSEQYKVDSSLTIMSITTAASEKKSQEISFELPQEIDMGQGTLNLKAIATSRLPLKYVSSDPCIAEVTDSTLHLHTAGEVSITVSQAGDESWAAAADVMRVLRINKVESAVSPEEPEPVKQPAGNLKKHKRNWLIAGGAAIVTGTVVSIILSRIDNDGGTTSYTDDRPPSDPILNSIW
jgi:hypothetical protein